MMKFQQKQRIALEEQALLGPKDPPLEEVQIEPPLPESLAREQALPNSARKPNLASNARNKNTRLKAAATLVTIDERMST